MDAISQMSVVIFLFAMATAVLAAVTAGGPGLAAVPIRAGRKTPAREV